LTHAGEDELGGALPRVLADRLRIYRRDADRMIAEAAELGARRTLAGEPLAARLEATAAGQAAGRIGAEHVRIIRTFFARLAHGVDAPTRADAEHKLAAVAAGYRPDELGRFAHWYANVLNPDGTFSDIDRARRRGVSVGPQGADGMSAIRGWLNPELRAGLDAVLAKWAAPGMCNPADEHATVQRAAGEATIDADCRSPAARNHDALAMMVRHTLMSGELGSHQGLPVQHTRPRGHEHVLDIGHLVDRPTAELTDPLGDAVRAVDIGLAELAAVGVDRQPPADLDRPVGNEVLRLTPAAESQLLQLDQRERREVVIQDCRLDIRGLQARLLPELPTNQGHLRQPAQFRSVIAHHRVLVRA
jgi:Domain of unknown function (DUF222)